MDKLKPCPFCGRNPIKFTHQMEILNVSTKHFLEVDCSCGMSFKRVWNDAPLFRLNETPGIPFGYEKAVEIWNRRTKEE